ncbi:MAG: oligosaccharide flippase family protein [Dehalococcoidia bacterium]|nr:oligosaccharide flippase family protein [Dehalococcoidia bacterium]
MRRLVDRGKHPDLLPILTLLALVVVFFWRVLFGGEVLLPTDALFGFEPWKSFAHQFGIDMPHNELLGDMIVQNYEWKSFARESLLSGNLPLWNPYVFAGMPFLAAGQYAVLYPLGVIFYLMPVAQAYGWFTALHVFMAGLFTYTYLRVIGANRFGSLVGAIAFMFSGFLVTSFIWPMAVSTIIWLPLLLAVVETILRRFEHNPHPWRSSLLYVLLGSSIVGLQFLAGHLEFSFFVLFPLLFYAVGRLLVVLIQKRSPMQVLKPSLALGAMCLVGFAVAAIQLVPFFELISANFRAGQVTYDQVISYAFPKKQVLGFVMPDFFGNPTHHEYFDVVDGQSKPVTKAVDFAGNPITYPRWSVKNYVEAAGYLGILPLLLAFLALFFRRDRYTLIFSTLVIFSLLLVFGTPLYRVIWLIPGLEQSHSPFRWVIPYSLSVSILAGISASTLTSGRFRPFPIRLIGVISCLAGSGILVVLVLSRVFVGQSLAFADNLLRRSQLLPFAFESGQMLYSYFLRNIGLLGFFLAASGLIVAYAAGWRNKMGTKPLPKLFYIAALGTLALDLFIPTYSFNTTTDPKLLDFVPPSLAQLKTDPDIFRITSYGYEDTMRPVSNMKVGLQDIRGYDSIILKQYTNFWRLMEEPDTLLYSMINKIARPASLESPILDLLNVKYVLTTSNIGLPNYTEVYRGEINIYRNDDFLPRATLVGRAKFVDSTEAALSEMGKPGFDPRRDLVITGSGGGQREGIGIGALPIPRITSYQPNRVTIATSSSEPSYLLLADSYFTGWRATVDGQEVPVLRADAIFRAVRLDQGNHEVIFRYSPDSVKLGSYVSFIGLIGLVLGLGFVFWQRFYPRAGTLSTVQRIAKNSVTPMAASLINKAIDFGYAIFMLRLLGLENAGKYSLAVALIGYFLIVTDFGLGTLLSREVAKEPSLGNRYLSNTIILRMILILCSLPVLVGVLGLYTWQFGLTFDTVITIALFAAAILPSSISSALSSVFLAREKMEYPAAVTIVSTLLKVCFGTIALFLGWGIIGLGAVSLLVNLLTSAILYQMVRRMLFRPKLELDIGFQKGMVREAFPLMINNLLSTVFFRIDVMLLKPMAGDAAVGAYGTAYRFIDGLNFIPSLFTIAIFPIVSRYAASSKESLVRGFTLSLKVLLLIAIPTTIGTTLLADKIILLTVGEQFRPAILALQILIWFLPFSFINSVTQYVLIAVNQQRFLTLAFVIGAVFNVAGNLIAIPRFGFAGAAVMTVLSEIVLMIPFFYSIRKHVGKIPLFSVSWRPAVASLIMGAVVWLIRDHNLLIVLCVAIPAYLLPLLAMKAFDSQDAKILRSMVRR